MLKYALLAMLTQRTRHGYDLKQEYDRTLNATGQPDNQQVNIGQVYSTLQRLEQAGWIRAEAEGGDGRERTAYRLLPEGRAALESWLHEPVEPSVRLRDDLFVKLLIHQLAHDGSPAALIQAQRMFYMQWLSQLTKLKARLPDDAPPVQRLLLSYAIRHTQADLQWLDECESVWDAPA